MVSRRKEKKGKVRELIPANASAVEDRTFKRIAPKELSRIR
jgi:hypothetical protein